MVYFNIEIEKGICYYAHDNKCIYAVMIVQLGHRLCASFGE